MSSSGDFGNPLRKFKLVFLGEQSGECFLSPKTSIVVCQQVCASVAMCFSPREQMDRSFPLKVGCARPGFPLRPARPDSGVTNLRLRCALLGYRSIFSNMPRRWHGVALNSVIITIYTRVSGFLNSRCRIRRLASCRRFLALNRRARIFHFSPSPSFDILLIIIIYIVIGEKI